MNIKITTPIKLLLVFIMLVVLVFLFRPKSVDFSLVSSVPSRKSTNFDPDSQLVFSFSAQLDPKNPYDAFTITPKTSGKVEATGDQLTFVPDTGFSEQLQYNVTINNIRALDGKSVTVGDFSFTTGVRKKSSFISQLPYDGGDYTVDLLGNGKILVTIVNPPADNNKQAALKFLKSKGVDTGNVVVQTASSALY